MKPAGKRIKGKRLEFKFAHLLRQSGLDKSARRRPLSGAEKMVRGHGDIISSLPFSFECKNQEKMKFWQWWEQAESQSSRTRPPVLVHTGNYRPIMVSLKVETFLDILKEIKDWKESFEEAVKERRK